MASTSEMNSMTLGGWSWVGVAVVLVVLFPLEDEKNVDVKTIFTCSQTCLLEMNLRVLTLHRIETRIASRQATALDNEKH